jgi:hypothetical protein
MASATLPIASGSAGKPTLSNSDNSFSGRTELESGGMGRYFVLQSDDPEEQLKRRIPLPHRHSRKSRKG